MTAPEPVLQRKSVAGVLASEPRFLPDQRFPGDVAHAPRMDWSRPEEARSEKTKDGEEDRGSSKGKAESLSHAPEKAAAPLKEKGPEAPKTPEAKPQQPQRQPQKAITGGSGASGGEKEAAGPSSAERAETVKKMSEQFQMSPGKPEMQRNAPLMTPLPGQAQAKETKEPARPESTAATHSSETHTPSNAERPSVAGAKSETATTTSSGSTSSSSNKSENKAEGPAARAAEGKSETAEKGKTGESAPARAEAAREKSETQDTLRRAVQQAREVERGEDFTGMRRSAGYQQAKTEMDVRQQHTLRESATPQNEQSEVRQSHSSQSSAGEGEGRGNQEKPGEELQQRSDRGERHQRRRQNSQSGYEAETEDEELLAESED